MNKTAQMDDCTIVVKHGVPKTTSVDVAVHFQKKHKNVLQSIENLDCTAKFSGLNFQPAKYVDGQNKTQPMYEMTRDGFMFLCMGFRGKKGKFGRLLAIIWLKGETGWGNINAELVEKGYAVYKKY